MRYAYYVIVWTFIISSIPNKLNMAPIVAVVLEQPYSTPVDIFSYGVVLLGTYVKS